MLTLHQTNLSVTPGDKKTTLRRSWSCPIKSQIQCLILSTCSVHHTILSSIQIQKSLEKTVSSNMTYQDLSLSQNNQEQLVTKNFPKKKIQIAFYFIYSCLRIYKVCVVGYISTGDWHFASLIRSVWPTHPWAQWVARYIMNWMVTLKKLCSSPNPQWLYSWFHLERDLCRCI